MSAEYQVLLVIPAYCENKRLPPYLQELVLVLSQADFRSALLIVDDGSPMAGQQAWSHLINIGQCGNCEVLAPVLLPFNQGKGGAILTGWRSGVAADWLAFVDADGALPADEVLRVLRLAFSVPEFAVYCGSRVGKQQKQVQRRWSRWFLGRAFAWFTRWLLSLQVKDSQCGFKLVPRTWFQQMEAQLQEQGYCFDLELLLVLQQKRRPIVEVSVDWKDQPNGKVRPLRDGIKMLRQACRMRKRFK